MTYFVVDANVAYLAMMLRQQGFHAEAVLEIRRRFRAAGMKASLHSDRSIAQFAIENNAVLITADRPFHSRCVRDGKPAVILVQHEDGRMLSKIEQLMIILKRLEPEFFQTWLALGKPSWQKYLKYGEGSWDKITKESKTRQGRIMALSEFDPLGYPYGHHIDRQQRI